MNDRELCLASFSNGDQSRYTQDGQLLSRLSAAATERVPSMDMAIKSLGPLRPIEEEFAVNPAHRSLIKFSEQCFRRGAR